MRKTTQNDDVNVIGFLREVWAARVFLAVGLIVGLVVAFGFLALAKPQVEARMIVGPAQVMDVSMQARYQDGQNSYVRAARNDTAAQGYSNFVRFEAMMRGVSVARLLLRDQRVVEGLAADRAFVFSAGERDVQPAELAQYIEARVAVDPFGETALKAMVYQHGDPVFAAYFLQQIHRVADQLIRADLRGQVDQRIAYLERVIGKTMNPEQRRIMTNLLLEQERLRMMVSMDAPVAASVIDPSAAGARAVWPDGYLFLAGFGLLGLMLGYLAFGVVHYQEEETEEEPARPTRGEDLQHRPKRPLKYGSWFQSAPDNDVDEGTGSRKNKKGRFDAAE